MANLSPFALLLLALCTVPAQSKDNVVPKLKVKASHHPVFGHPMAPWKERVLPKSKIINGQTAKRGQFPFYVAYEPAGYGVAFCGASLIDKVWALTAAHCNENTNTPVEAANFQVRVSAFKLNKFNPKTEEVRMLTSFISSPFYDRPTISFDYQLLHWNEPVTTVRPIGLFDADIYVIKGSAPLTNVGLGVIDLPSRDRPNKLQFVDLKPVSDAKCAKGYGEAFQASCMLCAIGHDSGSCFGDSGGPLFFDSGDAPALKIEAEEDRPLQIAVVSWGAECASNVYPGVYSKLSNAALDFIEQITGVKRVKDTGDDVDVVNTTVNATA